VRTVCHRPRDRGSRGVFAPGHLGELIQIVPFEMVDAVLAERGAIQRRPRKPPARVVVYLLLAAALFERCGYPAVWSRLTAALTIGSLPPMGKDKDILKRLRLGPPSFVVPAARS
jgi:hypothetical protein